MEDLKDLNELLDAEKLPESFIVLTNKKTKEKGMFGIKINYSIQQVKRTGLKTGGFSENEKRVGCYTKAVRKEFHQPEQLMLGIMAECLEKTIHPKLMLHRLKKQIDLLVKENPL